MNEICIVCKKNKNKIIFKEFEVYILKCENCGHVFSTYNQKQDYDNYFGQEIKSGDQFWLDEAHRKMYGDFCKKFIKNKSGRLLDAGCGLGFFIKKINNYKDWQVYGWEIAKPAVDYAQNKLNLKNIFCGKIQEAGFKNNFFDIITLWDVIEHVPDPNPLLNYLYKILKDDGFIFIHTPNIKVQLPKARLKKLLFGMRSNIHYLEAKDHINIYSQDTLKRLLNKNGFKKVEFIHLPPIQSVAGSRSLILKTIKNFWFNSVKFVFYITGKKINMDNLFATAKKQ